MLLGGGRPRLFLFPVCQVCETLLYAGLKGAAWLGSGLEGVAQFFLRWFWKRVWQKIGISKLAPAYGCSGNASSGL